MFHPSAGRDSDSAATERRRSVIRADETARHSFAASGASSACSCRRAANSRWRTWPCASSSRSCGGRCAGPGSSRWTGCSGSGCRAVGPAGRTPIQILSSVGSKTSTTKPTRCATYSAKRARARRDEALQVIFFAWLSSSYPARIRTWTERTKRPSPCSASPLMARLPAKIYRGLHRGLHRKGRTRSLTHPRRSLWPTRTWFVSMPLGRRCRNTSRPPFSRWRRPGGAMRPRKTLYGRAKREVVDAPATT